MTVTAQGVEITDQGTFIGVVHHKFDRLTQLLALLEKAKLAAASGTERHDILQGVIDGINSQNDSISDFINAEGVESVFKLSHQETDWLRSHDDSKWVEYLIYRYKFKVYPALKKLSDFPVYLLIEPTSVCNLKCVMCFQVDQTFSRDKAFMGQMPWELFQNVADQAREYGCHAITLASRGEPTLYKKFPQMLMYLGEIGILDLKINTNATLLTEKVAHAVLSAGVSEVVFSVDAGTKDTYEQIRVGGKFEKVVENIEQFNKIRTKHYPKAPTISRISGVKIRDDQDVKQMGEFWSNLVDQVTIKSARPRWDSYNNAKNDITDPCNLLWSRMYVWYDGKCNPCDFDYKSYLAVGNAYEEPLSKIWLGEKFNRLRQLHLNKKRCNQVPCDRCPIT